MREHPAFKKLSVAVGMNNYTIQQIQNAGYKAILAIVGTEYKDQLTDTFIDNMKRILIAELEHKQRQSVKDVVRDKILSFFPQAEFAIEMDEGKRKVTIWLEGKP